MTYLHYEDIPEGRDVKALSCANCFCEFWRDAYQCKRKCNYYCSDVCKTADFHKHEKTAAERIAVSNDYFRILAKQKAAGFCTDYAYQRPIEEMAQSQMYA